MCEGAESTSAEFKTGVTKAPPAPTLPPPTGSKPKPKPEPKVGHGTPGYKYGALESYKPKGTDYLGRDAGGSEEEHASNVRFGKAMEKLQGAINPKPGSLSKGLIKPAN